MSPLMCINIDVLFSTIRVVKILFGILVSVAGFINNGGMLDFLMARIQDVSM